jgi:heterodisulfide reductase subunit C/quinone-modifying oxidoreductase subunit QmoC
MMSMRRWLTAQYDFTGISRRFYASWRTELGAIVVLALLVGAGLLAFGFLQGRLDVYDGPGAFLPARAIHTFDWILAITLAGLLLVNCGRMWWFSLGQWRGAPIPPAAYVRQVWLLPLHFFTQRRWRECERTTPWAVHLVLVLSYVTLFTLIVFFLERMQRGPAIDWRVHAFGYAASAGLVGALLWMVRGGRQPHLRRPPHGRGADAGARGAVQQVGAHGVPAAGDVLRRGAGRCAGPRSRACNRRH